MTKRLLSTILACVLFSSTAALAAFPERSVRIIVPFAPGCVTDLAARLRGQLSTKWGQPVVIENRAGAGGLIGVDAAIRSPADGYTILMSANGEVVIHPAASTEATLQFSNRFDSNRYGHDHAVCMGRKRQIGV